MSYCSYFRINLLPQLTICGVWEAEEVFSKGYLKLETRNISVPAKVEVGVFVGVFSLSHTSNEARRCKLPCGNILRAASQELF